MITCPICHDIATVSVARSAKGRVSIVLRCPQDGRHFRAFINDRVFVQRLLEKLGMQSDSCHDGLSALPPVEPGVVLPWDGPESVRPRDEQNRPWDLDLLGYLPSATKNR